MSEDLLQTIDKLKKILEENGGVKEFKNLKDFEKEIQELKNEAETAKTDTKRQKALDKVKALELLKSKAILVFDNYKTLCEKLSLPVLAGDSKVAQLKELHRIFEEANFTDEELKLLTETKAIKKTAIVIDKIFDEPIEKVDGRTEKKGALTDMIRRNLDNQIVNHYILTGKKMGFHSQKELFKAYANYDEETIINIKKEMRKRYSKKIDTEYLESIMYSVTDWVERDLFLNGWVRNLNRMNDKNIGYNNGIATRIVTQEGDEEIYYHYVKGESDIPDAWSAQGTEFAKRENIKPFKNWDNTSMKYASIEQHEQRLNEFLKDNNNRNLILNTEDIYGNVIKDVDSIKRIQTVFMLGHDNPETLATKRISNDEINDLVYKYYHKIKDDFEAKINERIKELELTNCSPKAIGKIKRNDKEIQDLKLKQSIKTEFMFLLMENTVRKIHNKYI